MGLELFTNYGATTVSTGGGNAPASGTTQTWTVASSAFFPAAGNGAQFHVSDPAKPTEVIAVTNVSGTTWTVIRGADGTVPVAHSAGFTIKNVVTAGWLGGQICVVPPSGDTSGATDVTNINNAFTALVSAGTGGTVQLMPGDYYINSTITVPQELGSSTTTGNYPCSLTASQGATVIHQLSACSGASTPGIYMHRPVQYGGGVSQNSQPNPMAPMGRLSGFTLAGTGMTSTNYQIGIDAGDGWGGWVTDVCVKDFYSVSGNSIGIYLINRIGWSEKWTIRAHTINNDQHVVVDTLNPSNNNDCSSEYNEFDLRMYMLGGSFTTSSAGQMGIQWWNGTFLGGGLVKIRGNHGGGGSGNAGTVLQVGGGASDGTSGNWAQIYNTEFDVSVEGNGSSNLPHLIRLNNASGNNSLSGHGLLVSQYGGWQNSVLNGGNFKFSGFIVNDPGLQTGWPSTSFPGFGTAWTNNGPDALVTVAGGGTTGISVNGTGTGLTSGCFFLKAGSKITVSGSGAAPTWNVIQANNN
jgi:hypothetical protein